MSFSEEEIREFNTEAEDLLDQAEKSLLTLDEGGDFKAHYDAIFRAFHSIKGAAGMMEMPNLQGHMHLLENSLNEQKSQSSLSKGYIDLFLRGTDAARLFLKGESPQFDYSVAQAAPAPIPIKKPEAVKTAPKEVLGRVIVLDDEEDIVEILCSVLRQEHYEVLGLTDPTKLMEELEKFKPDMVFSDIAMPKMSGLQVLASVKVAHPEIPVVFISGQVAKDTLVEGIGLGLYGVIEKPFDVGQVIQICHQAVKQHQSSRLVNGSMNLLMYQFSDLDGFLAAQGKEDVRNMIRTELKQLLDQRRKLRGTALKIS